VVTRTGFGADPSPTDVIESSDSGSDPCPHCFVGPGMGAKTRQLAIAMVAVVVVLIGTVAWNAAGRESPAEQQTIGLDEVKLACFDVRQASLYVDGPYPGMAAGILDARSS